MKIRRFIKKRRQRAVRLLNTACSTLGIGSDDCRRYEWFLRQGEPIELLMLRICCETGSIRAYRVRKVEPQIAAGVGRGFRVSQETR